jgi:predicted Zn-dependent peptidase
MFAFSSESASNIGFWLGFSEIVADTDWFFRYLDSLAAVSVEDVQRVAQHYLAKTRRTVGHYVPLGK